MKTQLLFVFLFVGIAQLPAQTDGWYQFMGITSISTVQVVDTSPESVLVGTNIGLIKYNTTTQQVTDYLNFTSQNPPVGNIRGISQNPTNNEVALETDEGFAIYDGTNIIPYNYDNSNLTIGNGSSQPLKTYYGVGGELYLYKTDIQAYQIFENGVFEAEVATNFRPVSIMENAAGTKTFFAGWNNGLWELDKNTLNYTNYTTSNSDLLLNTVNKLYRDHNNLLYISTGGYVGFNTLDASGIWNTYQELIPNSTFHYPVFDFDVSATTGKVLVNSSSIGVSLGMFEVELQNNSWTHYTNDNSNCLNINTVSDVIYGLNDNIYVAEKNSTPNLIKLTPMTNVCEELDLNYLNAPDINPQFTKSFGVREKANGNLEIGFGDFSTIKMFDFVPNVQAINFSAPMTINPGIGIINDVMDFKDHFVLDNGSNLSFLKPNNTIVTHSYNLTNAAILKTKIAPEINDDPNEFHLVTKVFQEGIYRAYKTTCSVNTNACQNVEEVLTNNRTFEENFTMAIDDFYLNEHSILSIVKANSEGERSYAIVEANGVETIYYDDLFPQDLSVQNTDPVVGGNQDYVFGMALKDTETLSIVGVETATNNSASMDVNFDTDTNGINDVILDIEPWQSFDTTQDFINVLFLLGSDGLKAKFVIFEGGDIENDSFEDIDLPDLTINNPPLDFRIYDVKIKPQDANNATAILYTNFGFLVKNDIDVSSLLLDTNESSIDNNNVHLYPNPGTDIISFTDTSINHIEVFDLNGRKVLSNQSHSISVKTLSKGIYIVKGTTSENISISKKLIKN